MAVESTARPNGLKTVWDTIVAPKEALESLRIAPTWGWALLLVVVLTMIAWYLVTPAVVHGITADWPNTVAKSPQLAAMSADKQQTELAISTKIASILWLFVPVFVAIAALVGAVVLMIFNAVGHGEGSFGKYWAAQWNISIVSALGSIVLAVIVLARGPDGFPTAASVQNSMPSLAMLVPGSAPKLHAFLAVFSLFGIWTTGLEIAALRIIGRVGPVTAWLGGSLILILSGIFATFSVR